MKFPLPPLECNYDLLLTEGQIYTALHFEILFATVQSEYETQTK